MHYRIIKISLLFVNIVFLTSFSTAAFEGRVLRIDWGLGTRTNQVWHGCVSTSEGTVTAIPFPVYSQSEFGIYNQRESNKSWKMLTNMKNGGLYLLLDCPENAVITVDNAEYPFSFKVSDVSGEKPLILSSVLSFSTSFSIPKLKRTFI